ncbi:hypothetical protein SAMN04487910_4118 [Aquimarina amphilecti]|uniref:Uncharacterized protein n=1 Tax=Aquimarina amphilecti TaxID=1038014 RepID=A0A1H7VN89_AQUAM|nr:hypothetical protein [Aquimarina amphilecti]SEM10711.1 hypothetical protein SAMN04487910_4118 [Aquimarina amphilecti]
MKRGKLKKLSLDKIKIAKLNNAQAIMGGSIHPTSTDIPTITELTGTHTKICDDIGTHTSTKTVPLSSVAICVE